MKKFERNKFASFLLAGLCALSAGLVLSACGDDDEHVNEYSMEVPIGYIKNVADASRIVSDNEFVVEPVGGDKYQAQHVGTALLHVYAADGSLLQLLHVNVTGSLHLFGSHDPVTDWGCSRDYVRQQHALDSINVVREENDTLLAFDFRIPNIKKAVCHADYVFHDGGLSRVVFTLEGLSESHPGAFMTYFSERFRIITFRREYSFEGFNAKEESAATTYMGANFTYDQMVSRSTFNFWPAGM